VQIHSCICVFCACRCTENTNAAVCLHKCMSACVSAQMHACMCRAHPQHTMINISSVNSDHTRDWQNQHLVVFNFLPLAWGAFKRQIWMLLKSVHVAFLEAMFACMCACLCCVYVCVCANSSIICACTCTNVHTCTCTHLHVHACTCMCVCVSLRFHMCANAHLHDKINILLFLTFFFWHEVHLKDRSGCCWKVSTIHF